MTLLIKIASWRKIAVFTIANAVNGNQTVMKQCPF